MGPQQGHGAGVGYRPHRETRFLLRVRSGALVLEKEFF